MPGTNTRRAKAISSTDKPGAGAARERIEEILNAHARKAQAGAYDRDVCVLAILAAREALMTMPAETATEAYSTQALKKLEQLFDTYNDPDGEFTSGKGVIGALIDDIRASQTGEPHND